MGVFRFKHFSVTNERSAMKVNTDGVLLGAAMTIMPQDRRMLDVGTGTGTIALMAAQRMMGIPGQAGNDERVAGNDGDSSVRIDAIDIDEPSGWRENFDCHLQGADNKAPHYGYIEYR